MRRLVSHIGSGWLRTVLLLTPFLLGCWSLFLGGEAATSSDPAQVGQAIVQVVYYGEQGTDDILDSLMTTEALPNRAAAVAELETILAAVGGNYNNLGGAPPIPPPPVPFDPQSNQPTPTPVWVAGEAEAAGEGEFWVPLQMQESLDEPYGGGSGEWGTGLCLLLASDLQSGQTVWRWTGGVEAATWAISGSDPYAHAPWGECESGIQPTPVATPVSTPPPGGGLLGWPVNISHHVVTAEYGCYAFNNGWFSQWCHDTTGGTASYWHNGRDFAGYPGGDLETRSVIAGGGFVSRTGNGGGCTSGGGDTSGYGNYVEVQGSGYRLIYAHLSDIYVTPGSTVAEWEAVGHEGTTGCSSGIHLHYANWFNGEPRDPRELCPGC